VSKIENQSQHTCKFKRPPRLESSFLKSVSEYSGSFILENLKKQQELARKKTNSNIFTDQGIIDESDSKLLYSSVSPSRERPAFSELSGSISKKEDGTSKSISSLSSHNELSPPVQRRGTPVKQSFFKMNIGNNLMSSEHSS